MNTGPKWYGFVYRHLVNRAIGHCVYGLVASVLGLVFAPWLLHRIRLNDLRAQGDTADCGVLICVYLLIMIGVAGLGWIVYGVYDAATLLDRHPDVLELGKFGPPRRIVAEIDAEIADRKNVVNIGSYYRSFEVAGSEVLASVTRSWLVLRIPPALDRLTIFRLNDIVVASRIAAPYFSMFSTPLYAHSQVQIIDRHGRKVEMPLRTEAAARLLAEIMARAPGVLDHFDADSSESGNSGSAQILTETDRPRPNTSFTDLAQTMRPKNDPPAS